MVPATMKAVITDGQNSVELREIPVPKPGPKEALVKVVAVAQNPTDWKSVYRPGKPEGLIVGCDFSGVIVELGSEVSEGSRKVGEHVASFVPGSMIPNRGAFAEYLIADAELLIHIPNDFPFDGAAGIGVASFTTFQMLYQSQSMATPSEPTTEDTPVLVWSGASAVGQYVIQVAKASGYTVITTASKRHHSWLKQLGADVTFDYKDSDVGHKIREYTNGKLKHAFDCISEYDSPQKISDSLSPSGGVVSIILPYNTVREEVKVVPSLAYTIFQLDLPGIHPVPEHHEAAKEYAKSISQLVFDGKLQMSPIHKFPNGLASVKEGLAFHKAGKVSGEKITYIIEDTP